MFQHKAQYHNHPSFMVKAWDKSIQNAWKTPKLKYFAFQACWVLSANGAPLVPKENTALGNQNWGLFYWEK